MEKEVRYFVLLAAFIGNFYLCYTQDLSTPPPEPMLTDEITTTSDCGGGDGGSGSGIPPPVGLCLPINNYLLPLLVSGVALGAFALSRLEIKKEPKISAL